MGLIKAALGSVGGVLADQWKEYLYCDSMPADVLMTKAQKRTSGRSSNTNGEDNVISNGSVIAVANGQCMIIVEQGKVVDICAEPGEYKYDTSSEPSIFAGNLGESIKAVFNNIGKRFTFGGTAATAQYVYFVNTKEIIGNKYGTPSPIPFRVVDQRCFLDVDISVRCFGEYSYRITNPILFYSNIASNVSDKYTRDMIDSQLKSELLSALQPAFAQISEMGIRYSAVPAHTIELSQALNKVLSKQWGELRGIEIVAFGVSSIKASEEDEQMIKEHQRQAAFMNPGMAAAHMVGSQAQAMRDAANNTGGAAMAFMGMGMAQQQGGISADKLFELQAQQQRAAMAQQQTQAASQAPAAGTWTCSCGAQVSGKFCTECGAKKPEKGGSWKCSCGKENQGKFCSECGSPKPQGTPQYKCDKCGWEPEDPTNPPKFCPECGDPFNDADIVK